MSLSDLPTPELARRLRAYRVGDNTDPGKVNQLVRACAERLLRLHQASVVVEEPEPPAEAATPAQAVLKTKNNKPAR